MTASTATMKSMLLLPLLALAMSGCVHQQIERAKEAKAAKTDLVGLSKKELMVCMGIPSQTATQDDIEVWSYDSGNGQTNTAGAGGGHKFGGSLSSTTSRACTVNLVLSNDHVSKVTYIGPTGSPIAKDEQCAYAVQNCLNP